MKRLMVLLGYVLLVGPSFSQVNGPSSGGGTLDCSTPINLGNSLSCAGSINCTVIAGASVNFYVSGGYTVPSKDWWHFNITPDKITYNEQPAGNYSSVSATWYGPYDGISVYAGYSCGTTTNTTNPLNFSVINVQPSLTLRVPSYCYGRSNMQLEATNILNGGTDPRFTWSIDGNLIGDSHGATIQNGVYSSQFSYSPTTPLATGRHSAQVSMYSDYTYATVTATATFDVLQSTLTPNLYTNGVVCSDTRTQGVSVTFNSTPPTGTLDFTWYYSGNGSSSVSTGSTNYYTYQNVVQGQEIWCVVKSTGDVCPAETVHKFIDVTSSTNAVVSILTDQSSYCEGKNVTVSSSQVGDSYSWTLNSISQGQNKKSISFVGKPGDAIYLSVTGITGGSCLRSKVASAYLTAPVFPLPNVNISPSGTVVLCTTCTQTFTTSPNNAGYTYQWNFNNSKLQGKTSPTLSVSNPGNYTVTTTTANGCSKESNAVALKINYLPIVNAGMDQLFVLPLASATLAGSGSDVEGPVTFAWSKVSGPSITLSNINTPSLVLTNLLVGKYQFKLTGTDNIGESSVSYATVIVDPPNNYNYVRESTIQVPLKAQPSNPTNLPADQVAISTTYYDGLGRPLQNVITKGSPAPAKNDIVASITYDAFGRETTKYLPYPATGQVDGYFKPAALRDPKSTATTDLEKYQSGQQYKFYQQIGQPIAVDSKPYAVSIFEPSPLNRVVEQGATGVAWQPGAGHTITKSYQYNQATDRIYLFTYDQVSGLLSNQGFFTEGQLYANRVLDEHQNLMIDYIDKQGRTVCKMVQSEGTAASPKFASTYYVYDGLGNLVYVIPPEGVIELTK